MLEKQENQEEKTGKKGLEDKWECKERQRVRTKGGDGGGDERKEGE